MGSFSGLLNFFGTLFGPIGQVFHWIFFEPVFNALILIYHGVGAFWLAIVLLTLVIRGALFPLTRRQLASTRKMQELAPKVKAIQAQHRGNPQEAMAAQQALYKEHGVSMYGGCLPMLIQMPFIYALFYAFEALLDTSSHALHDINAQIYPFLPKLTFLPQTHFLWTDLKTPDQLYILPILAGILTFVQLRMAAPVKRPGAPADPTQQTAKTMQWIMPFFTAFIGTRFAAGLALYWTVSTGFSAFQQYLLTGWGSLFVGVPGMERFVPEPKDVAPATPALGRGGVNGAASDQPAAQPMGFMATIRDLFAQVREQAQTQTNAAQDQTRAARVVEAGAGSGAVGDAQRPVRADTSGQSAPRERKPRPGKSGAMLVRPDAARPTGSNELPEDRIARDMSAPMDGIIGDDSARSNGSGVNGSGANGSGANGSGAQRKGSGAGKTGNAGRPTSGQRPGGGSGGQRSGQQARRKGKKGGR